METMAKMTKEHLNVALPLIFVLSLLNWFSVHCIPIFMPAEKVIDG